MLQARLSGRSAVLDRRVHAVRDDLADIALASRVIAPRYAAAVPMQCGVAVAPLRSSPACDATQISELLFGETFAVFDRVGGWAWGQGERDGYVGWVEAAALGALATAPTRQVTVPHALRFVAPTLKAAVVDVLPLGAAVAILATEGVWHRCIDGAWLHDRHLAPSAGDIVDLGFGFVDTPYRWGGRTRSGIDCSGLIQALLHARGIACPRDADQQGAAFPAVGYAERRRGDLVVWPGHVGVLVDRNRLLHANAFWMATKVETLAAVVDRQGGLETTVVRPPCGGMVAPL